MLQFLVTVGPLIAGFAVLAAVFLSIYEKLTISPVAGAVLAFGAFMFLIPALSNFTFKSPGFELSGQLGVQGAELKLELADIKQSLNALAKQAGGAAASTAAATVSPSKPPAQLVLIFYTANQKNLALKLENYLLHNGYAANAVYTDFAELSDRQSEGTTRLVYVDATQILAEKFKDELPARFPEINHLVTLKKDKLSSADFQIQLF
ncbi:MAG: hypothetical protein QOF19_541 [Alphaproteobacteria bacterium]|jgi:hypothetical protein|nr:hypothetical protein [Alphaproteobacteria bacterium]